MSHASMNPEEFDAGGGLARDFDGTIREARFIATDYGGKAQQETLALRLKIEPDEADEVADAGDFDDGFIVPLYSAGSLDFFAPGKDPDTQVDLDAEDDEEREGWYAVEVGSKKAIAKSTNLQHFLSALVEAGFPTKKMAGDIRFLEGLHAHFDRVPQRKRSGLTVEEDDEKAKRQKDILVVTNILDFPDESGKAKGKKGKAKAKPTAKSRAKPKAETDSADLDTLIVGVVSAALDAIQDEDSEEYAGLDKDEITAAIMQSNIKGAQRAKAVKRASEVAFLSNIDAWDWDAKDGAIYPASE